MSFFSRLFGSNKTELKPKINKPISIVGFKNSTTFSNIDFEFIDLIFFKDDTEKTHFINNLEKFIIQSSINNETTQDIVLDKFSKFIDENNIYRPCGSQSLFVFEHLEADRRNFKGELFEDIKTLGINGVQKLDKHHTALNLSSQNINKKIESGFNNLDFEEKLIINALKSSPNMDFYRIESLYQLGNGYYRFGLVNQMNKYYEMIENEIYELSPNTTAKYYKMMGEDYYDLGLLDKSYHLIKKGIELNPKLGVKKLMTIIENKKTLN